MTTFLSQPLWLSNQAMLSPPADSYSRSAHTHTHTERERERETDRLTANHYSLTSMCTLFADYEYESVSDESGGVVEAGEGTGVGERPTVKGKTAAHRRALQVKNQFPLLIEDPFRHVYDRVHVRHLPDTHTHTHTHTQAIVTLTRSSRPSVCTTAFPMLTASRALRRALRRGERTHRGAQATEWAQTWRKNTS